MYDRNNLNEAGLMFLEWGERHLKVLLGLKAKDDAKEKMSGQWLLDGLTLQNA